MRMSSKGLTKGETVASIAYFILYSVIQCQLKSLQVGEELAEG